MVKKLISRSKFAAQCGVSAAAVTKACAGSLAAACDGKRIDLNHPAAKKYLSEKTAPRPEPTATGLDPLYEEAIDACVASGRWTASHLQRTLKIGYQRAGRILASLQANNVMPDSEKPAPTPPSPAGQPTLPPRPHRRGKGAARDKKKQEAWAGENELVEIPEDIQSFADMTLRELIERFGTDIRFTDWLNAIQKIEAINEKRLKNAEAEGRLISRALVRSAILDRIDGVFVRMLTDGAKTISARAHSMALAGSDLTELRAMVEDQLGSFIRPAKVKMVEALNDAPD